MSQQLRVAAIQLDAQVADVDANLAACERLAESAASAGAEWIILPEFFSTGVAFREELVEAAQPPDGPAAQLLIELARSRGVTTGGSFLCRDADGHTRNAFMLFGPDGELLGRHDKDLPTMWENCFYVGGDDIGLIDTALGAAGVALCWELIRTQTAQRLCGRAKIIVGGSCWWTVPSWHPRAISRRMEAANARNATRAAPRFAALVGAPVVHAAHCGEIECPLPWTPLTYRGRAEGGASISDEVGNLLAFRSADEGEGFVVANVRPGTRPPARELPDDYWLCHRGAVPSLAWSSQRAHGRRWYAERHGGQLARGLRS